MGNGKFLTYGKFNNIFLNNQLVNEKITKEIKEYFEINENENLINKMYGMQLNWCLEGYF